jgi:hypothetical protein
VVSGANPFYAVNDESVARKAQQDLHDLYETSPPTGSAAEVTSNLVSSGFSCGIATPLSTDVPSVVCSKHWPTDTCRIGLAKLDVTGPVLSAKDAANVLWSTAHSVHGWQWSCLDPTNNRNDDINTFIFGSRRNQ